MAVLPKGASAPLSWTNLDAVLEWTEPGGVTHDVDLSGLLLGADGRVRGGSDFVFYNQPRHPSGAVTHRGRAGTAERLNVALDLLPDDVDKIVLVGSVAGGSFAAVEGLAIAIVDAAGGGDELRFDSLGEVRAEALVVGELGRRNGHWEFRAAVQGWESGLAGLATSCGVRIGARAEPEQGPSPTPARLFEDTPAPKRAAEPTTAGAPEPAPAPPAAPAAELPRAAAGSRGWKGRAAGGARGLAGRAKDAAARGAATVEERVVERAGENNVYQRVSSILTMGDESSTVTPERFVTLFVHAVRQEDQENIRERDVIKSAVRRQRLVGLASMPAGPIGVYVSSLYCEAAILCHVERLHRLGLDDRRLAAHLLGLWNVMPDLAAAESALDGSGPSVLSFHAGRARAAVSDFDVSATGELRKADVLKLLWGLRRSPGRGVQGTIGSAPGSISPKDVLLPRGRVAEVFATAQRQLGVS